MDPLLFRSISIAYFACALFMIVIVGYLLTVRQKSRATWMLTANMAAALVFCMLELMLTSSFSHLSYLYNPLIYASALFFCSSALAFAYEYIENPLRRESRLVLSVSLTLAIAFLVWCIAELASNGARYDLPLQYISLLALVQYVVIVSVFLRKRRMILRGKLYEDASSEDPRFALPGESPVARESLAMLRRHRAKACISFSLFLLLIFFVSVSSMLRDLGLYSNTVNVIIIVACLLLYSGGFVIVYLLHSPEPSTFQVKLIGLTLMAVFIVLSLLPLVLVSEKEIAASESIAIQPLGALRFTPGAEGVYLVSTISAATDTTGGERLEIGRLQHTALPLGFPFPCDGTEHDTLHVSLYGYATLVQPSATLVPNHIAAFLERETVTTFAPYAMDADKGQRRDVRVRRYTDSIVISWHGLQLYGTAGSSSFQLVLRRDGGFEYRYLDVDTPGIIGFFPAGSNTAPVRPRFDAPVHLSLVAGTGLLHDTHRTYLELLHEKHGPIAWILVGVTVFIVAVFPRFYHSGLIMPLQALLNGVQQVDRGELNAGAPVVVHDEIGHLAASFNRMTHSLRDAEHKLRAYAENLEALVDERTAKLKATQQQLVRQEKLASLGQLTSGIAHEIKNPLNFINNFASTSLRLLDELEQGLREKGDNDRDAGERLELVAELRDSVSRIRQHGGRVDGIVAGMMLHSRDEKEERKEAEINTFLPEAAKMALVQMHATRPDFEPAIEFVLAPETGSITGVRQDLMRLFINLILNGMQAADEKARDGGATAQLRITTSRSADGIEVRIRDNGRGIPSEIREKIFQPFFTTKPTGAGTGLGLSIGYDIAVAHGGNISVESVEGEFAEFLVRFAAT